MSQLREIILGCINYQSYFFIGVFFNNTCWHYTLVKLLISSYFRLAWPSCHDDRSIFQLDMTTNGCLFDKMRGEMVCLDFWHCYFKTTFSLGRDIVQKTQKTFFYNQHLYDRRFPVSIKSNDSSNFFHKLRKISSFKYQRGANSDKISSLRP